MDPKEQDSTESPVTDQSEAVSFPTEQQHYPVQPVTHHRHLPYRLLLICLLLAVIIALTVFQLSTYLLSDNQKVATDQIKSPPVSTAKTIPQQSPVPSSWLLSESQKCSLTLKHPPEWSTEERLYAMFTVQGKTLGCMSVKAPDYEPYKESNFGLVVWIDRAEIGATFKDILINDLNSYITAHENVLEPLKQATTIQEKAFGEYRGKYYELSAFLTTGNFVFQKSNFIYHISWPKTYNGEFASSIDQIIASIMIIE